MADYNIRIRVDAAAASSQLRKFENRVKGVEASARSSQRALKQLVALVGLRAAIRDALRLTDAYIGLQNRLRLITNGYADLQRVTEKVYKITVDTNTAFVTTADIFVKLSLSLKNAAYTEGQLLSVTKTLNQAVILSGGSAHATGAALVQLGQAMASGKLAGEELRSVMEQMPVVADIFAKQLGVVRTELYRLGPIGKITTEAMVKGLINARKEMEERFAKIVPTLTHAFINFNSTLTKTLGELNTTSGAVIFLSKLIRLLGDNIEFIIRSLVALAVALTMTKGITVSFAKAWQILGPILTGAVAPFSLLMGVIAAVTAITISFGDTIKLVAGKNATLIDGMIVAWERLKGIVKEVVAYVKDTWREGLASINKGFEEVFTVDNMFEEGFVIGVARMIDNIIGLFYGLGNSVIIIFKNLPEAFAIAFIEIFNTVIKPLENLVNTLGTLVNEITTYFGGRKLITTSFDLQLGRGHLDDAAEELAAEMGDAFIKGFTTHTAEKFVRELAEVAEVRAKERNRVIEGAKRLKKELDKIEVAKRQQDQFAEVRRGLEWELELLKMSNRERQIQRQLKEEINKIDTGVSPEQREILENLIRTTYARKDQVNILDRLQHSMVEYKTTQEALNSLIKQGAINTSQYNKVLAETEIGAIPGRLREEIRPIDANGAIAAEQASYQRRIADYQLWLDQQTNLTIEAFRLREELEAHHVKNLDDIRKKEREAQRDELAMYLHYGTSTFDSLTQAMKNAAGERSNIYRAMFAASKAFAVAETTLSIGVAIASAVEKGWPQNLPMIAATVAQTAGLLAQITSVNPTGFQTGGSFKVGGSGDADSQLVAFRASPNETVSIRTPSQQHSAEQRDQSAATQAPQPEVRILNIIDPSMIQDALQTPAGERTILNVIRRNNNQVAAVTNERRF